MIIVKIKGLINKQYQYDLKVKPLRARTIMMNLYKIIRWTKSLITLVSKKKCKWLFICDNSYKERKKNRNKKNRRRD